MKPYLQLLKRVIDTGEWTFNERTQKRTLMIPGAMMTFDLREGFPAVTTKKLAFGAVVGELCAFLRASRSAADFRALGCKVWDQNANENQQWLANPFRKGTDDLGPVYGVQWREWPGVKILEVPSFYYRRGLTTTPQEERDECNAFDALIDKLVADGWNAEGVLYNDRHRLVLTKTIDQLVECIKKIIENPSDRRNLFHGWNPAVLDEVALPACHVLYQFLPNSVTKTLHMNLYQRSCDNFLGSPFNIASAAALMHLVGRLTGYMPGLLNVMQGDSHVYEDHLEQCTEQLLRDPYYLPTLKINDRVPQNVDAKTAIEWLRLIEPTDFELVGYQHHPALKAPMAV